MLRSEYPAARQAKIAKAARYAREMGKTQFVCEVDDGGEFGERSLIVCDEDYCNSDEFSAFDGRILDVIEPYYTTD